MKKMEDWNIIECGFNIADETINFGGKSFTDGDNLFEVSTLASIRNEYTDVSDEPQVYATVKSGKIFFSINNSLRIFENLLCSNLCFNGTFDATVDCFCVTRGGEYLLLCLQNGTVHCFSMKNELKVIYTDTIADPSDTLGKSVFSACFTEVGSCVNFVIILDCGKIVRLSSPIKYDEEVESVDFNIVTLTEINFKSDYKCVSYLDPVLIITDMSLIYIYNLSNGYLDFIEEDYNIRKIFPFNKNLFLALDDSGEIVQICSKTLLISYIDNCVLYDDFIFIEEENKSDNYIFAVTKPDELNERYIQLIKYLDQSTIFSLKLSSSVNLIHPETINDECMYIAKLTSGGNNITELRFQLISETLPEKRLSRLLRKQKFEEAEKFAVEYNIDLTLVKKAKVQFIVDKRFCDQEDIKNMLNIFEDIQDYAFKLQCCIDVQSCCNRFEDIKNVLNYGCKLVSLSSQKLDPEIVHLENTVSNLMYRFDTFMAIVRHGSEKYDVQDWNGFSAVSNLFEELMMHLKLRHFQECIIIYDHLDSLTLSVVNEDHIQKVLDELNTMSSDDYISFLYSFVPITLRHLPSTLSLFVKWLLKKIFQIERSNYESFPANAIDFTNKLINLVKVDGSHNNVNFQRQCCLHQQAIDRLSNLVQALEQLKTLRELYNVTIPLAHYLQGPENLIHNLLNIISPDEDYKCLLEKFLCRFMIENGLNPDEVFMKKIKDLLNYQENFWIKVVPLLLDCINSVEMKLQSVLEILKTAEVPWSKKVHEIAHSVLNYSHPLVTEIVYEIEYEPRLVVLKKKVYGLAKERLIDIDDLKFFVERIIYCNTSSVVEDVYKLCKNDEEIQFVTFLLVTHYAEEGDLERVLNIIDRNNEKVILNCCKKIVSLLFSLQRMNIFPENIERNFYEISGPIFNRIFRNVSKREKHYFATQQLLLRNLYNLKRKFSKNVTLSDLTDEANKKQVLEDLLDELMTSLQNNCENGEFYMKKCNEIASCLNLSTSEIVLNFCNRMGSFEYVLDAAEVFYKFETNSKCLCFMAILLLKTVGVNNESTFVLQETVLLEDTIVFQDVNVSRKNLARALSLSEKLLGKAILNSGPYDLNFFVTVLEYFQVTFYFVHSMETRPKYLFKNLFLTNSGCGNMASIKWFVNYYSKLAAPLISLKLENFDGVINHTIALSEGPFFEEIKHLPFTLQKLHTEGHYLTAYKLVTFVKQILTKNFPNIKPEVSDSVSDLILQYTTILLQKIFSAPRVDTELAYALLLTYDSKYSAKLLMKALALYKRDIRKFEIIARLGLRLQNYHKITGNHLCKKIILLVKWYNKIENCPIAYDDFFQTDPANLIKQMIKLNIVDLRMLIEFCSDFDLDLQHCLLKYLRGLLLYWKPKYEVKVDLRGRRELVMHSTDEELFKLISEVIEHITNKDVVNSEMQMVWNSINFYHYEVFICILKLLSGLKIKENITNKLMLSFLKSYGRISKPSQTETEQWYTCFPDSQNIDPLSEWRLPFTPTLFTKDIWNIIRSEINLKTYNTWFKVATILKNLNNNDICSYVVKEEVSKITKNNNTQPVKGGWNIMLQYKDLFEEIDACVQNITDLEQATSAMYHVFMHTPPGADQVNAIHLCYKYALKYKEKFSETSGLREAFTKVEKKYYSFSTIHILHMNELADSKYLNYVTQPPEKLIEVLYADERILKKADCLILRCPDINKTVDEIADLHGIDIEKMRLELLNCWLSDATLPNLNLDTSSSFNVYFHGDNFLDSDINEKNLKRASYMCTSGNRQFWQMKLLKIGMNNDVKNTSNKARALKCLCTISDAETLEGLTGSTYQGFRNYVDKLFLISDLEYLGFPLDVNDLDKCNKRDLLKRLAQDRNNPASVKLMASICSTYTIYEIKFWEIIINAMIKMKMLKELKEYVNFLNRGDVCQHKKFYKDAWQSIVDFSFNFTTQCSEEELNQKCTENIHLIQSCPVLFYLNFENAIEKCIKMKKFIFAAILLQYLPESKQETFIKILLELNPHLNADLLKLTEFGFWGVPYVINLFKSKI